MKRMQHRILIVLLFIVFLPAAGSAASLLVNWNANTESDLAGYKVYYGTQTGTYGAPVTLGKVTSYTLANVTAGRTYYFALTAYDTSGNESARSAEVSAYVPATQTQASLSPVSPLNGAIVASAPRFTWRGTGFASYSLYASLGGRSYTRLYTGTGTSYGLSSAFWSFLVPSGSRVSWYVRGTTAGGQVTTSAVWSFRKQ